MCGEFFSGHSLVVPKKTLLLVMVTFASMDIYGKKTRGLYKLTHPSLGMKLLQIEERKTFEALVPPSVHCSRLGTFRIS